MLGGGRLERFLEARLFRRETFGQALDLGGMLGRGCLACRLEALGQALHLGGMLGGGRLERFLEARLLRLGAPGQALDLSGMLSS